jgi:hypothetical protein
VQTLTIVILDHDINRIRICENSVQKAVRELGLKAVITQISEPPYLARKNVWEQLPVLEINGLIWSRKSGQAFSKGEVVSLLRNKYMQ